MTSDVKQNIKYNFELLNYILNRDNSKLSINTYDKLTRNTTIYFICNCGIEHSKDFIYLLKKGGAFCSDCTSKNRKKKCINTCMQRYGVDNPLKDKNIKNKQEATCIERYGQPNPLLCDKFQEKRKNTMILNYGVINPSENSLIQEKRKQVFIDKYGVDNPLKNKSIKDKQNATILSKYGVENISQNQTIQEKIQHSSLKFKEYKMPSGEIRKIQGYENLALNELLNYYSENEIKTRRKDVPRIQYSHNEKDRYYFPDIFIPNKNLLIEVKSEYTFNINIDINYKKRDACITNGYNYEFWIYDNNGNNKRIEY